MLGVGVKMASVILLIISEHYSITCRNSWSIFLILCSMIIKTHNVRSSNIQHYVIVFNSETLGTLEYYMNFNKSMTIINKIVFSIGHAISKFISWKFIVIQYY